MSRRSIEVSGMHYGKVSTPTRTITVKRSAKTTPAASSPERRSSNS